MPPLREDLKNDKFERVVKRTKNAIQQRIMERSKGDKKMREAEAQDQDGHHEHQMIPEISLLASDLNAYGEFIEALRFCSPMRVGFHVPLGMPNKLCYCPCGKHMKKWFQIYDGGRKFAPPDKCCNASGPFQPHALLKHLEQKKKDGDNFHFCCHEFLHELYKSYWGEHSSGDMVDHAALYDPNSKKHQRALLMEAKADQM